jgi:hypothetical protein
MFDQFTENASKTLLAGVHVQKTTGHGRPGFALKDPPFAAIPFTVV